MRNRSEGPQRVHEFSTVARQQPSQPEVGKPGRENAQSGQLSEGRPSRAGRRSGGAQSQPSPSRHVRKSGNDPEGQSREVGLSVPREYVPRQNQRGVHAPDRVGMVWGAQPGANYACFRSSVIHINPICPISRELHHESSVWMGPRGV